jgi:hypothetical protein
MMAFSLVIGLRFAVMLIEGDYPDFRHSGMRLLAQARNDGSHFCPAISFAACPNIFLRASSSNGSFTNLPIASPACT